MPSTGKYGFHLHAETYIVSSGSSDSISFDTVDGGLFRISNFSIGPKLFDVCMDTVNLYFAEGT